MYWIRMGMGDWIEVEKQEYVDFIEFAESSRARDMQWRDTEDQLSEFDLDHQAWFQPFNKLKDGQDGRDLHKRRG